MRIVLPHLPVRILAVAFCLSLFSGLTAGGQAVRSDPPAAAQGTTELGPALVLSSRHRLSPEMWAAIFAALRANLPEAAAKVPAQAANPEFLRADDPAAIDVRPGKAITVYLRGDCRPSAEITPFPWRARLGWVDEAKGTIVPIIHVECTEIGEEIAARTRWMNEQERISAMSEAIARVVLHEWVHVAAQTAAHGSDGVTKAKFNVDDLLPANAAQNSVATRR